MLKVTDEMLTGMEKIFKIDLQISENPLIWK